MTTTSSEQTPPHFRYETIERNKFTWYVQGLFKRFRRSSTTLKVSHIVHIKTQDSFCGGNEKKSRLDYRTRMYVTDPCCSLVSACSTCSQPLHPIDSKTQFCFVYKPLNFPIFLFFKHLVSYCTFI